MSTTAPAATRAVCARGCSINVVFQHSRADVRRCSSSFAGSDAGWLALTGCFSDFQKCPAPPSLSIARETVPTGAEMARESGPRIPVFFLASLEPRWRFVGSDLGAVSLISSPTVAFSVSRAGVDRPNLITLRQPPLPFPLLLLSIISNSLFLHKSHLPLRTHAPHPGCQRQD